jgi:tetratricopeptide (TPR) repeat protein
MKESQIQAVVFAFAALLILTGIVFLWNERAHFVVSIFIFIPAFLLTLAGALGPTRLRDLLLGAKKPGPDDSSKRHFCSETERNICLVIAEDFPPPRLTKETKGYVDAAENRAENERSAEDYLILSTHAWRSRNFEKALPYVFEGLRLDPGDKRIKAALLYRLGTIVQTMSPAETAVKCYNDAIKLNPLFSWPHNSLGLTYRYQKEYQAADKEFEEAIRLHPENTRPRYNLGVSYMSQKRFAEAEKVFREIIQMDPPNYRAHNRLGLICLEQGKPDKAEEEFREALKIEPTYAKAQKNLVPLLQEKARKTEETKKREEEAKKNEEEKIKRDEQRKKEDMAKLTKKEEPPKK